MKKTILTLSTCLLLNVGTGFAAPVNNLADGQTALGISGETVYVEHKFTDNFTLGYQNIDRDNLGNMDDIYGQFQLGSNLRGIIGNRNFDSNSKMYLGMAVHGSLASNCDGYASLIGGDEFKELQVGTNFQLANNLDLNLAYHSYMPDEGSNKNGFEVGATFKF